MTTQKKLFTKITAVIAALMITLSMFAITATAASIPEGATGTITVENAQDTTATATAYKILDVEYDHVADQPKNPEYFWAAEVKAYITANYPDYINNDGSVNEENYSKLTADESKAFFADLALAITSKTINLTGTTAGNAGSTTISNLKMGSYLVLITGGVKVYQPIAVNLIPKYDNGTDSWSIDNQTITDTKSNEPTITKTAYKTNVSVGDVVTYTLNVTLPSYPANATGTQIMISDKLPEGLTYNNDVKFYGVGVGGAETELVINTDYTEAQERPNNLGEVDFAAMLDYTKVNPNVYSSVKVVYTATANKNVVLGTTSNVNTAHLDYNNDPYDISSLNSKDASAKVYSYGIDITKVAADNTNTTLDGAQFTLSATENGTAINFVRTAAGKYRVAEAGEAGTTTLETANGGKLIIDGLALGTYYLKETKAPAGGYKVPTKAFEITIADADGDGNVDGQQTAYAVSQITNSKTFELPSTGGMGTVIFTISGIVLVALGATMIIVIRKKSKTAENN